MGFFDNATEVILNNKEVISMKVGNNTIYEKISSNNNIQPKITLTVNPQYFYQSNTHSPFVANGNVAIDWGDGSEVETYTGEHKLQHTFLGNDGEYTVLIYGDITGLGRDAFYENNGIVKIILSDSIESIGDGAFDYCTNLLEIVFESTTPPTMEQQGYYSLEQDNIIIKVPQGSLNAYQNAENYPTGNNFTYVEYTPQ